MRIKSINIAAFGGIKSLTLTPNNGLNVIYGANEDGKTTVMSFIKMMFYGSGRNSADIVKSLRKKYTPWDGSNMAGSIDFEHSGKNYRIERQFRKTDAADLVTLIDLDLGERTAAAPDIGVKFFGLSAAAFERSLFIGQFGFPEGDPEGEIGKRLSNIALTGEESVSFDTVNTRLLKAKNALMSKSGNAGAYDKNLKNLTSLRERLQKAVAVHEEYIISKERLTAAEKEIEKMEARAEALKKQLSAEQDIRNARKLENLLTLKKELDTLNEGLKLSDGSLADDTYVKKLQMCINRADTAKAKYDAKLKEAEILNNSISAAEGISPEEQKKLRQDIASKLNRLEEKLGYLQSKIARLEAEENDTIGGLSSPQNLRKKVNAPLLAVGMFLTAAGLIGVLFAPLTALVAVLGILLTVLGFILRPTDKRALAGLKERAAGIKKQLSEKNAEERELTARISELKAKSDAIDTALAIREEGLAKNKELLAQLKAEAEVLKAEFVSSTEILVQLFSRFKPDFTLEEITPAMEKLTSAAQKQKEIKQQINYILKDIGNISYKEAAQKLKNIKASVNTVKVDFDAAKTEYEALTARITEAKAEASAMRVKLQQAVANAENPEELKKEISALNEKLRSQKAFCDAAMVAAEVLTDSFSQVRRSYGSTLDRRAAEILSRLTGDKYCNVSISKSFEIAVEQRDQFGRREVSYLSNGTADQAYLSLRLALSRLMQDSEALPIFMDDALAQYDDERLKTALEFLTEYGKENQILLFTCHKAVCDIAAKSGASVIEKLR